MKKIILFFTILVILLLGGSYYAGNKFVQNYEEISKNSHFINNNKFEEGLFSTKATSDIVVTKQDISEFFGVSYDEYSKDMEDMKFKVISTTYHGPLALILGLKTEGYVEIENENFRKIFTNGKIMNFTNVINIKGDNDFEAKFSKLNLIDRDNLIVSPIFLKAKLNKNSEISNVLFKIDDVNLSSKIDNMLFSISGIEYDINFKTPIGIKRYIDILNTDEITDKITVEKIVLKTSDGFVEMSDIDSSSIATIVNNLINYDQNSKINKLIFEYKSKIYKLNSINFESSMKNISLLLYENMFNSENTNFETLTDLGYEFLIANPSIEIKNFNFKNEYEKNFTINAKLGIKDLNRNIDIENVASNLFNYIYGDAKLTFDKSYLRIIDDDYSKIEQNLLNNGILIKDGENLTQTYKIDQNKKDIILNNKFPLLGVLIQNID